MGFLDEKCKEMAKEIDEANFKFLAEHGYKVEKPYTVEKVMELKERLDNDGKVFAYKLEPTGFEDTDDGLSCRYKLKQQLRDKTENDL